MSKLLDNAIATIQEALTQAQATVTSLTGELNADQSTVDAMQTNIDSLTTQLASLQSAKTAEDALLASDLLQDKKDAALDYLRGWGRLLKVIPPTTTLTVTLPIKLSWVQNTAELQLFSNGYSNAHLDLNIIWEAE
jgi:uncharacterized coiled-coil protein SlyX